MPNLMNINFNLDYYSPQKPRDNIFLLANKSCECREIIVSIDLDNLIIGQSYTIVYSSVNQTAIFSPATQTIRAASNSQKFSTIAYIDPSKTHIVKAEISGINVTASQMCVIKCGDLQACEVIYGSDIVLNANNNWEYKFDDFSIFKFIPAPSNSTVSISIPTIPEVASPSNLRLSNVPLLNSSADIKISNVKIGTLIYLTKFDNSNLTITKNGQNYIGTITPGVFYVV
jgi:hypothetical protein